MTKIYCFAYRHLIVPTPLVKITNFSPPNCLYTFVIFVGYISVSVFLDSFCFIDLFVFLYADFTENKHPNYKWAKNLNRHLTKDDT